MKKSMNHPNIFTRLVCLPLRLLIFLTLLQLPLAFYRNKFLLRVYRLYTLPIRSALCQCLLPPTHPTACPLRLLAFFKCLLVSHSPPPTKITANKKGLAQISDRDGSLTLNCLKRPSHESSVLWKINQCQKLDFLHIKGTKNYFSCSKIIRFFLTRDFTVESMVNQVLHFLHTRKINDFKLVVKEFSFPCFLYSSR